MLKATGSLVVFSTGARTYGKYRESQAITSDGNGFQFTPVNATLLIREGTQPATLREDDIITVAGVSRSVRDMGYVNADGTRLLNLRN